MAPSEGRPQRRQSDFLEAERRAQLHADVQIVAHEARALRRALSEVASFSRKRRRRDVIALVFAIFLAIHSHEVGRNICGGHRFGLDHTHLPPQAVVACDVAWPESSTDPDSEWPSAANLIGFGLYVVGGTGLVLWYRRTRDFLAVAPDVDEREMQERGYEH